MEFAVIGDGIVELLMIKIDEITGASHPRDYPREALQQISDRYPQAAGYSLPLQRG